MNIDQLNKLSQEYKKAYELYDAASNKMQEAFQKEARLMMDKGKPFEEVKKFVGKNMPDSAAKVLIFREILLREDEIVNVNPENIAQ